MNYYESAVIPEGKCTVKQAFAFISQHKDDPIKYSSENIAAQYKIDKKVMGMYNFAGFFKISSIK